MLFSVDKYAFVVMITLTALTEMISSVTEQNDQMSEILHSKNYLSMELSNDC